MQSITYEGVNASGKSYQINQLRQRWKHAAFPFVIMHQSKLSSIWKKSRFPVLREVLIALERQVKYQLCRVLVAFGVIVILDRCFISVRVYSKSYPQRPDVAKIAKVLDFCPFKPEYLVFVDTDPVECIARRNKGLGPIQYGEQLAYLKRLRSLYQSEMLKFYGFVPNEMNEAEDKARYEAECAATHAQAEEKSRAKAEWEDTMTRDAEEEYMRGGPDG